MGPLSWPEIRFQGKYVEAATKEKEHMSLLQNKLHWTKSQRKIYGLQNTSTLKFYDKSGELLIGDYFEYIFKIERKRQVSR